FFVFFFSSRRRHTRFSRDWSSDVCSSDLVTVGVDGATASGGVFAARATAGAVVSVDVLAVLAAALASGVAAQDAVAVAPVGFDEIGRASCRERVEMWGGAVAVEKERVQSR